MYGLKRRADYPPYYEPKKQFMEDDFTEDDFTEDDFRSFDDRPHMKSESSSSYYDHDDSAENGAELEEGPYGKLVIIETTGSDPCAIIRHTMSKCNIEYLYDSENVSPNLVHTKLSINGILLSEGKGEFLDQAKEIAADLALKTLRESSYTLKVNGNLEGIIVDKAVWREQYNLPPGCQLSRGRCEDKESFIIEASAVKGNQLRTRKLAAMFRETAFKFLEDYIRRDTDEDLIFTNEFSLVERGCVFKVAKKMNLYADKNRFNDTLEVSKRNMKDVETTNVWEIAKKLLRGGSSNKYELIPPNSCAGQNE